MPCQPPAPKEPRSGVPWGLILHRSDQICLAVLAFAAFVGLGIFVYWQGIHAGQLIDIDRSTPLQARYQIDLNAATWPEWNLLPGIGEGLAKRIVAYREQHGPFGAREDLLRVKGVGPVILDRISPYLQPIEEPRD